MQENTNESKTRILKEILDIVEEAVDFETMQISSAGAAEILFKLVQIPTEEVRLEVYEDLKKAVLDKYGIEV